MILALKNITTPDFGGAAEVTVIELLVKPGDVIEKETPIVTLESDKATMELPSTAAGTVKELKVKIGDKVSTGDILLTVESQEATAEEKKSDKVKVETAEEKPAEKQSAPTKKEKVKEEKKEEVKEEPKEEAPILTGTVQTDNDVHAGPGVRRLARELGVNLKALVGSGPRKRILKEDVQKYVKTQLTQIQTNPSGFPLAPAIDFKQFGEITLKPLSRIQKISGKNLQRNWVMIPHVTQFGEADITTLEEFRLEQKDLLEKEKVKLTPLAFVMKAVVSTLKAFPQFNASLDPTGENLIMKNYFHIGVAVDTPDGLIVPVVRDIDKKGLIDIAKELAVVSEKARKKQLMPADMQGGCFSISSLGGIGGTAFTPIINAPEVAILGVSKASHKPVYQDKTFVPRLMLPLSLSYDHRVIDGADGARFMMHLTKVLSDIRHILM